jgi:hypothetical protein
MIVKLKVRSALMTKIGVALLLAATTAFGQYKLDSAGAPPSELVPAIRDALQKDGAKVVDSKGNVVCELWFRTSLPSGSSATSENNVSLKAIPHGTLLGAIRFSREGSDRRGQAIKAGVYTLRLSYYPVDGAHQGVATQRDFALMVPAADDKDLNSTPDYAQVVALSNKASGTSHPAVLSLWKAQAVSAPELKQEGDDWVLYTNAGGQPVAILVVGVHQA